MCQTEAVNGVTMDGGYAEYVLLRSEAVVSVPTDIDPVEYAPILCAGITVFNSMRKMSIPPGEIVAVQGLGGLGHLALQYANKMGYRVVALSSGDSKRDFAKKLGAHEYINTSKEDVSKALMAMGGAALVGTSNPFHTRHQVLSQKALSISFEEIYQLLATAPGSIFTPKYNSLNHTNSSNSRNCTPI